MCSSKTSQGSYIFHIIVNNSFNINTALKYRGENCVHPKNERFVSAVPSLECLVVIRMWVSACLSFRASTWKILSSLPMDRGLSRPWLLESASLSWRGSHNKLIQYFPAKWIYFQSSNTMDRHKKNTYKYIHFQSLSSAIWLTVNRWAGCGVNTISRHAHLREDRIICFWSLISCPLWFFENHFNLAGLLILFSVACQITRHFTFLGALSIQIYCYLEKE